MTRWCSFCDKRGHNTYECWYKNQHIKEIAREDGKLKKKYKLPPSYFSSKSKETRNTKSRSKSPSPNKKEKARTNETKPKPFTSRRYLQDIPGINRPEIIDTADVTKSKPLNKPYSKCEECLKWNKKMQDSLAYQEITRNEYKQIIKNLTEKNMELNQRLKKATTERNSFRDLYECNKQKI